jgi:hypothetical protein
VGVIVIDLPSNVEKNSRKIERERLRFEPDMEKLKVLDCFQIKGICWSVGELEL